MGKTSKIATLLVIVSFLFLQTAGALDCSMDFGNCKDEYLNASLILSNYHDAQCSLIKTWMTCVHYFVENCGTSNLFEILPNTSFYQMGCVNDSTACGKTAVSTCISKYQTFFHQYMPDKCRVAYEYRGCLTSTIDKCNLHPSNPVIYPQIQRVNHMLNDNNCDDHCTGRKRWECDSTYEKETQSKVVFNRCGAGQTYLDCIKDISVFCGTELRNLNFSVDTSKITKDMSFNQCGTDAWVCIAKKAMRCRISMASFTLNCFGMSHLKNCYREIGKTCSHDTTSPESYIRQATSTINEDILKQRCVDDCAARHLRNCSSRYALEEKSAINDKLKFCSATANYERCVDSVASLCYLKSRLSPKNFTFIHINDTRLEVQDLITHNGCQNFDICAVDELKSCSYQYTKVASDNRKDQVEKCSAAVIYMECMNKMSSVCNLRSDSAIVIGYLNDTRNNLHKWMSSYGCFSDEVCALRKSNKCALLYTKASTAAKNDTLKVCSAAYDYDKCLKKIVADCNLATDSKTFVSLQYTIFQLEAVIKLDKCPSVSGVSGLLQTVWIIALGLALRILLNQCAL